LGVIGFWCVKSLLNPESSVETHNPLYNFLTVTLWIWIAVSLFAKILMVADKKIKWVPISSIILFGIVMVLVIILKIIESGIDEEWSVIQNISIFIWIVGWVMIDGLDALFNALDAPKQQTK
jgi:cell division protein FtsW (lipid II flippase)